MHVVEQLGSCVAGSPGRRAGCPSLIPHAGAPRRRAGPRSSPGRKGYRLVMRIPVGHLTGATLTAGRRVCRWRVGRPLTPAIIVALGSLALLVSRTWGPGHQFVPLDLSVYRDGSGDVLGSGDLYQDTFGVHPLPFTYPPSAAIALLPLRFLGFQQVGVLWTGASLACLLLMLYIACRTGNVKSLGSRPGWPVVLMLFAWLLWLEPVQSTVSFGQINLILDGLIVLDVCCDIAWLPKGTLLGIAAAIKLVPLFFIVYRLLARRTRAAATAAISFAAVTSIGWAAAPDASRQYWTRLVFNTDRVGSPQYVANQSLHGVIVRALGVEHSTIGTLLWAACALVTAIWGLSIAVRLNQRQGALPGLLVAAGTSLLVAPTSWSHYYVWVAPAAALLVLMRRAISFVYLAGGLLCVLVFFVHPIWWLPNGHNVELHYSVIQQVLASSYVIATLLLLAGAEVWARQARPGAPAGPSEAARIGSLEAVARP